MSYEEHSRGWDLSPVINLIHSLSFAERKTPPLVADAGSSPHPSQHAAALLRPRTLPKEEDGNFSILGNFDNIWTSLGRPLDVPPPKVKWEITATGQVVQGDTLKGEESDPEAEAFSASKGVRWRDEDGTADLEDNDEPEAARALGADGGRRRKRPGKRARQAARSHGHGGYSQVVPGTTSSDFESETELQKLRESPRTKARSHHHQDVSSSGLVKPRADESSGPSSTSPPKNSILKPPLPWPVSDPFQHQNRPELAPTHYPLQIESITGYTSAERKINLVMKLVKAFPEDCNTLVALPNTTKANRQKPPTSTSQADGGIHVFVDSSNIIIGFFDTLKRARGIPPTSRVRRAPLSFHNLALILERGRPTAKRVLVGSKPLVPAVEEAQECGYETSILDRVMKAREAGSSSTPRKPHRRNGGGNNGGSGTSGRSSGSESASVRDPAPQQQRMVEQAVDEILHLKLLESVVDAASPSTIVLATGDAAEAEYSAGFMRMVERALEKGWKVELVAFRQNTSFAYRRRAFRDRWGDKFQVILLDDFREELLDL
ncbi:MAG: YmL10 [Chaenotheca gracillima]|nr:MAG: YmL10 [Chaenotheca gracillima]